MIIQMENDYVAHWDGGHYINFHDESGYNYDCISFMWEKNKPTQLDALQAFLIWKNLAPTMSDPTDKV